MLLIWQAKTKIFILHHLPVLEIPANPLLKAGEQIGNFLIIAGLNTF